MLAHGKKRQLNVCACVCACACVCVHTAHRALCGGGFQLPAFRGGDASRHALVEDFGASAPAEDGLWLEVDGSLVETTASTQTADTACCVGELARAFRAGVFGLLSPAATARAVVMSDGEPGAWASSFGRMGVAG